MPARLVVASANPAKVVEIARILGDDITLVPRPTDLPEPDEDAPTLEGNALIKANAVAVHTGEWAIADDTGLEVIALGGEPGVRSARYAGDTADDAANRARLLDRLVGISDRRACFHTVVALMSPSGEFHLLHGRCWGTIALREHGEHGFGYDSVFVPDDGDGRTFAEMSDAEKDAISHRARALAGLPALLARIHGTA